MIVPSVPESSGGELQEKLAQEVSRIRGDTAAWQGAQRKVRFFTKVLVQLLKGML